MNRVLNKGPCVGSYLNSALVSFSDVFHPAFCMQSCNVKELKEPILDFFTFLGCSCFPYAISASHAGESMRSGNAC